MIPSPYRCSSSSSITNEPHCNRIRRSHDTMHVRLKSRPSDSSSVVSTIVLIIVRKGHIFQKSLKSLNGCIYNAILYTFRYRNGQLLDLNNRTRYGGATIDQPSLVIHAAHKQDTGSYSCVLENVVGASESQNAALLDVYCK